MFSENQKISGRQLNRMLILDLFAAASMLLPKFLVHTSGGTGFYALGVGTVIVLAYSRLLYAAASMYDDHLFAFVRRTWNTAAARVIAVYFMLRFFFAAVYYLKMFARVINRTFITEIPEKLIGAFMLAAAYYGVSRGIEARGRFASLLIWIVTVPILLIVVLAIPQMTCRYVFPLETPTVKAVADGSLSMILLFTPVEFLLFAAPYVRRRGRKFHFTVGAVVFGALAAALIYLVCTGIFTVRGAVSEQWPSVILMQIIRLPGRFMSRQDGLMLSFWIVSAFMAVSGYIFYAGENVRQLIGRQRGGYVFAVCLLLVYGTFCMIKDYTVFEQFYFRTSLWCGFAPTAIVLMILVRSSTAAAKHSKEKHTDQ